MLKTESISVCGDGVDLSEKDCIFTNSYYPLLPIQALPSPTNNYCLPLSPTDFITTTANNFPFHEQQLQPQVQTTMAFKIPKDETPPIDLLPPTPTSFLDQLHSPSSSKRPRLESSSCSLPFLPNGSSASRLVTNNELARMRRQKISDKTRCLSKLLPWDTKMDTCTMLEEAHKYVMFLQAQVKSLQSMPTNNNSMEYNTTCFNGNGSSNEKGFVNGNGLLGMLNRQQLLQVLVNSPVAQTRLYKQGCCIYSIEQLMMMTDNN